MLSWSNPEVHEALTPCKLSLAFFGCFKTSSRPFPQPPRAEEQTGMNPMGDPSLMSSARHLREVGLGEGQCPLKGFFLLFVSSKFCKKEHSIFIFIEIIRLEI